MSRQTSLVNKRVEDGRHQEVGDATASIAKTTSEGIGSTNNILVEEAGRPDLTRNEAATENAHKETKSQQTLHSSDGPSQSSGNGTNQEASSKGVPGTEAVT